MMVSIIRIITHNPLLLILLQSVVMTLLVLSGYYISYAYGTSKAIGLTKATRWVAYCVRLGMPTKFDKVWYTLYVLLRFQLFSEVVAD